MAYWTAEPQRWARHMLLELLTLQDAAACSHTDVVSAAATAFVQLTSQR